MRSWKVSALKLGALAPAALVLGLSTEPHAQAAGTQFVGTVSVTMNITLRQAVTGNQVVYCQVSLEGSDQGGESFKAARVLAATKRSNTSYMCTVAVPYNWDNQIYGSDTLSIYGTYVAVVYDSTLPITAPAVDSSEGTWVAASNITAGGPSTYTTPVTLY